MKQSSTYSLQTLIEFHLLRPERSLSKLLTIEHNSPLTTESTLPYCLFPISSLLLLLILAICKSDWNKDSSILYKESNKVGFT